MGRVLGRRVLITGGSGHIGGEIARTLASEGGDIAIQWHTNEKEATRIVAEIESYRRKGFAARADLRNLGSINELSNQIKADFGRIDTLVNCAGVNRDSLFSKMTPEQWDEVIQVNLSGAFHCSKAFLGDLVSSGSGRIVNITSVVGQKGNIGQANYAASKAGLIGLTKSLAVELSRFKVTVNAIAPGFVESPMVAKLPDSIRAKLLAGIPAGRFGLARDVALAVLYLISPEASYINGAVLPINGGLYL